MSSFDTKNLIYKINKLNQDNKELQEKLAKLEEQLEEKTCGSCTKNCGNDWCVTKTEGRDD